MKKWAVTLSVVCGLLVGGMYASDVVGMYWPIGSAAMWAGIFFTLRHRNLFNA